MRHFFSRMRRLLRWIPVIWRNQTWDYQYTLNILGYSLEELAHCLENGMLVNGPRNAKRIRCVCNLIQRIDNGTAWDMTSNAKKVIELESMYWDEIWDTIKRYGQGWWD